MRNPVRNQLPDPIPALQSFVGIVNTKRSKAFGYGGLQVALNVEVDDDKRLVRRDGYELGMEGAYDGLYGSQNQRKLLAIRDASLISFQPDMSEVVLAGGMLPGQYSWDEDPNNNIYFTSTAGSSGIVMDDGTFRPLMLVSPTILSASAVNTAGWQVLPFKLGARYTTNVVHLFATFVLADERETAPSESITISVSPNVSLISIHTTAPPAGGTVNVYATAPGGSTYYLVSSNTQDSITFPTLYLNRRATGADYPYTTGVVNFPDNADMLACYNGSMYASMYDEVAKVGVIYKSMPLQYHLFQPSASGFISVSGQPLLMLPCKAGLVIGTDTNIYLWNDEKLETLTEYGVVPGVCGDVLPNGTAFFWTLRGVAKAMPYELVTEPLFSGDPGVFNHARIFHDRGYRKLVASTVAGNKSFNQWRSR